MAVAVAVTARRLAEALIRNRSLTDRVKWGLTEDVVRECAAILGGYEQDAQRCVEFLKTHRDWMVMLDSAGGNFAERFSDRMAQEYPEEKREHRPVTAPQTDKSDWEKKVEWLEAELKKTRPAITSSQFSDGKFQRVIGGIAGARVRGDIATDDEALKQLVERFGGFDWGTAAATPPQPQQPAAQVTAEEAKQIAAKATQEAVAKAT